MKPDLKGFWLTRDGTRVEIVSEFMVDHWKGFTENRSSFLLYDAKGDFVLEEEEWRKWDLVKRLPEPGDYVIGEN